MRSKLLTKIALLSCVIIGSLNVSSIAYAKTIQQNDVLKKEIQQKNDTEFDQFMTNYIKEGQANKKTIDQMKNYLNSVGVELKSYKKTYIPKETTQKTNSLTTTASTTTYPSDVSISSYIAKRIGDSYYRIYTQVDHINTLWNCGSLDLLSVEWDPTYFSYYSYNSVYYSTRGSSTSFINLFDTSKRSSGILLFSVEDARMYAGDSVSGVAYVKPIKSGSSEFQGKYIHTYDDTSFNWTVGGNVGYSKKDGWNGGMTFTISPSTTTKSWQVIDINGTP